MITVKANARSASYDSDDLITSGSAGIPCEFVLSSDFNGLSPIAVFEGSGTARDVALMGNTCVVPHEVLTTAGGYLRIGIYASNSAGTIVIPTVWAGSKMILQGTEPSEVDPSEPTPSWVAQVQAAAAEAVQTSEEAIEIAGGAQAAAEEARESASAAAGSATAAAQSESAASGSATSASGSASAAAQSATAAAGSASGAASSASAAEGSATAAAGSAAAAAASEAAARAVQESIPEDYADLSADVVDLKSEINGMFAVGSNLIDPSKMQDGYVDTNGVVHESASYKYTDFIPVEEGATYAYTSARFVCAYDIEKHPVSSAGKSASTTTYTVPSGIHYVVLSISSSGIVGENNAYQMSKGSTLPAFEEYKLSLLNKYATIDEVEVKGIVGDLLTVKYTYPATLPSASGGVNIGSVQYERSYIYVLDIGGLTGQAIFINTTSYATGRVQFANGVAFQVADKTAIAYLSTSTGTSYTGNVYIIDVTGKPSLSAYLQTLTSTQILALVGKPVNGLIPVKTSQLINDSGFITAASRDEIVYSRFGVAGLSAASASASSGATVTVPDFPNYLNKGLSVSFYGLFSGFTSLRLGFGYQTYRGRWLEIDGTSATIKTCQTDGTEHVISTTAHGLTFSDYIAVTMTVDDDGDESYAINTKSGTFTFTGNSFWHNGVLFATLGQGMTKVVLNGVASCARQPMWFFGDSYLGFNNDRIMGQLRALGYTKGVCVDALSGNFPSAAYVDLQKMLALGKPKYLVWMLGMNDNGTFISTLSQVVAYCAENGIELILYDCPSTPTKDRAFVRTAVEATGLRYIDANLAVGASADGASWYTGYLSSDEIHPTELGAKAIAMRCLVDVPEIMEFVQ